MPRIVIEDLPLVEPLTKEELQAVFGAGFQSFGDRTQAPAPRRPVNAGSSASPDRGAPAAGSAGPRADFSRVRLKQPALDLLEEKKDPAVFLQAALDKHMLEDALAFVPQWLSAREAVWWGCLCVWQVTRGTRAPEMSAALKAAADWALGPDEKKRRAAEKAGAAAPIGHPSAVLAQAAFFTGDSIAPAGQAAVPPPPNLGNESVANAMTILCAKLPTERKEEAMAHFIKLAIDVCRGKLPWQAQPPGTGR